jgi:ATP-dependent helicase/nuclease subunit A
MSGESPRLPPDHGERERALDVSRSFIVQAPAGSGKTELLIRRYLALLERVEKPEDVLAITFTKKAAAEMKKRVLERRPALAASQHRLRIMTIDAFCASLTRQAPVVARFGAQPEVETDPAELYLEAATRTLADVSQAPVERLLAHLDNDVAAASVLLADLLQRRDQWMGKTGAAPTREELEASLASERKRLLARACALHPEACEAFAQTVLTKAGDWRKKPKPAPPELVGNEPLRLALVALLEMPPERFTEEQWAALSAILDLLAPALAQLLVVFAEHGAVDFTQVAHGALHALGEADDPSDLLLALDLRVQHILVDEFQDTSVSQWQLLRRLTAGWQRGDGRTVFAVGDPMQSIYRFREAEVSLFLGAWRSGLPEVPLEPIRLATNFRSQERVVQWVNNFFTRALPEQADESTGAVPYTASSAFHAAKPGDAASWHCFDDRAGEAAKVVELVRAAEGSTAILVRNRSHLDAIVPALKAAGLRYRSVEIEPLGERQAVQDLYALTRALSHPADRIAWLALLRAPWCGLDLHELSALCEGRGDELVWSLMEAATSPARLVRVRETLRPFVEARERGSLRLRVERAWLALGGPACVASATDLADADAYLDALEDLEEAGAVDMAVLDEKLTELWALPDVDAGGDAVQIMTIHKAKGLEFDTVIVPGLDRAPRAGSRPLFAWKALPNGRLLLAPIDATGGAKEPLYRYVRELDKESEDIEAGRLFYVAATRAISRLHLLGCVKRDEHGAAKSPGKRSLLAKGWFEAADFLPAAAVPPPPLQGEGRGGGGSPDVIYRLPSDWVLPPPPPPVAWTAPPEGRESAEQIEFSWAGETARHVGTVVHRWLQRIGDDALHGWDAAKVASLHGHFARQLERRGVPAGELESAVAMVTQALQNAITHEKGRWVLGAHPETKSEHRVRLSTPDGVRTYVMDRVFTTADGARWVVDYKTSRHQGTDLEGFLDRERERYAGQLTNYARILAQGGKPAKAGIYFPLAGGWRESR